MIADDHPDMHKDGALGGYRDDCAKGDYKAVAGPSIIEDALKKGRTIAQVRMFYGTSISYIEPKINVFLSTMTPNKVVSVQTNYYGGEYVVTVVYERSRD